MRKARIISLILIVLGFVFECLYYTIDSDFLNVKFGILGVVCLVAGVLGLWISTLSLTEEKGE